MALDPSAPFDPTHEEAVHDEPRHPRETMGRESRETREPCDQGGCC